MVEKYFSVNNLVVLQLHLWVQYIFEEISKPKLSMCFLTTDLNFVIVFLKLTVFGFVRNIL